MLPNLRIDPGIVRSLKPHVLDGRGGSSSSEPDCQPASNDRDASTLVTRIRCRGGLKVDGKNVSIVSIGPKGNRPVTNCVGAIVALSQCESPDLLSVMIRKRRDDRFQECSKQLSPAQSS